MRAYHKAIDTFYDLLINDPEIKTVTKSNVRNALMDIDKNNAFPMAHINVVQANFTNAIINFTVAVFAMDLRGDMAMPLRDKWQENDRENDNLDRMLYVQHRLWQKLRVLDGTLTVTSTEDPEPFTESGNNVVDGWIMVFNVSVIEEESGAC